MTKEVKINEIKIGGRNMFCLIAGPCVIENEETLAVKAMEIMEKIKEKYSSMF